MLSNIANYLLGYGDAAAAPGRDQEPREADIAPTQRLISETEDDDWVVVNKQGDEGVDVEGATAVVTGVPVVMEESWFVTPPPCFASTGPVSVETSPLENLLIEHPSMSVYRRSGPPSFSPTFRRSPEGRENRRPAGVTAITAGGTPGTVRPAGRAAQPVSGTTPGTTAPRQHRHPLHHLVQQRQIQQLHHAQKVENWCSTEVLKKGQLDRGNKVREVVGRNRRQRRSDRQNKHSGANNNRKSC